MTAGATAGMTEAGMTEAGMTEAGMTEAGLAAAVIDTLLAEDYGGLAGHVERTPDGPALRLPGGRDLVLPLRACAFLADWRVARPAPGLRLDDVLAALAAVADAEDAAGVAAFGAECRAALAALRLRERHLPAVRAALARVDPGGWLGPDGSVRYDALAAGQPHPVYPASAARLGFGEQDGLRYAPEFRPEFELNWVAVPGAAIVRPAAAGCGRPGWWPAPADVGLPAALAGSHDLIPVHPVTARQVLGDALAEAGLAGAETGLAGAEAGLAGAEARLAGAVVAPGPWLRVRPTLSVRTVAVTGQPGVQLKLPLPVSTLGLRNQRAIIPATLADGALVHQVLTTVTGRDPGLDRLLLADDGDYAHAGHRYLGYLLRRLPGGLAACRIVPVAALLAPGQGGRLVIEDLAGAAGLSEFFLAYLDLVFGVAVRLFVRYGIALEAHQQNAAVVVGPGRSLRLLVKDFDGTLINHGRLASALGSAAPEPSRFADPRLLTGSDDALADVFITITVHLCAGALAFGLAGRLPQALDLVRDALSAALDEHGGAPAAALLRRRVLAADRLPGKAMVTAGTLRDKARTGASDVNKCYGPAGPNYLRPARP
jgi:IucA / IucC family/Ferric iron reductase FhuF-like transporter